jgi:hypothetical protein
MRKLLAILALLGLIAVAEAGIPPQTGGPVQTPPANDQATAVVSGSITAATACASTSTATAGCSSWFMAQGTFNVVFGGASGPNGSYSATLAIDRSFDGGSTWYVAGVGGSGAQAIYSTPNQDVSLLGTEPERGVLYRLRCSAWSSGTINYRFSTGPIPTTGNPL